MEKKLLELLANFSREEVIEFFKFFENSFDDLHDVASFFIKKERIEKQDFLDFVFERIESYKNNMKVLNVLEEYELSAEEQKLVNKAFNVKEISFDELTIEDNAEPKNIKNLLKLLAVPDTINFANFKKVMNKYPKIKEYLKNNYFEMESYRNEYINEGFVEIFKKIDVKKNFVKKFNDIFLLPENSGKFLIKVVDTLGVSFVEKEDFNFLGVSNGVEKSKQNNRLIFLNALRNEDFNIFAKYYSGLDAVQQEKLAKGYFDLDIKDWRMGLSHLAQNVIPLKAKELSFDPEKTVSLIVCALMFFKEKQGLEDNIKINIETLFSKVFTKFNGENADLSGISNIFEKYVMNNNLKTSNRSRQFKL